MWARLDDAILDNPKIIAAGPLGFALHVAAITWCARNLTDGCIPKRRVAQLLDLPSLQVSESTKVRVLHALSAETVAEDLIRIGLWHDRGDEYELHDYLVYNWSKARILAERERERSKKSKQRQAVTVSPRVSPGDSRGNPAHPVPVPVPVLSERSESQLFIAPVPSRAARAKPKTPWPPDFTLTDELRRYAERNGLDAHYEWGKFQLHAERDDQRHANWPAAFKYWIRNAWELQQRRVAR